MQVFKFVAPDGTVVKRRTKSRTYTHAILYRADNGKGRWVMGSCVGRPDLVAARLEYWGRGSPDCVAVPAERVGT